MKLIRCSLPLLSLLFAGIPLAHAQSSFDLNLGFGSAHASANGGGIDSNTFSSCVPGFSGTTCLATPSLGGFFLGLGGDLMLQKHYGIGAEVNFTPAKSDYGPLQFRQTFYDINGILAPINEKRVQIQIQGGLGGAKTGFSFTQTGCVGTALCSTQSQSLGNSSHFQIHAGVGVQFFITNHIFIRPQFDLHYVPNFDQQFGTNTVPAGTVWVGYSFGDRS